MKSEYPKVSIIIPVYNGANYLQYAIDSALRQTYENIEIIVVNDGSNDSGATEQIALSYGDKITYYAKPNGGVSSALNYGIERMNGEYFSWLSHDDLYMPEKVEKQMQDIMSHGVEDKLVALCGTAFVDKNGAPVNKMWSMPQDGLYDSSAMLQYAYKNPFCGLAFLIPRNAFKVCGMFDESLSYIQDIVMWKKLFLHGYKAIVDNEKLVSNRLHAAQQTALHKERFRYEWEKTCESEIEALCAEKEYTSLKLCALEAYKLGVPKVAKKAVEQLRKDDNAQTAFLLKAEAYHAYGAVRPVLQKVYYAVKMRYKLS